MLTRVYSVPCEWTDGRNPGLDRLTRQHGPREIGPGDLPRLVTFADLADPRSVEAVDPADLAASFGAGVRLRRVTGDPVTEGVIEQRLPWLREVAERSGAIDGIRFPASNESRGNLGASAFKRRGL